MLAFRLPIWGKLIFCDTECVTQFIYLEMWKLVHRSLSAQIHVTHNGMFYTCVHTYTTYYNVTAEKSSFTDLFVFVCFLEEDEVLSMWLQEPKWSAGPHCQGCPVHFWTRQMVAVQERWAKKERKKYTSHTWGKVKILSWNIISYKQYFCESLNGADMKFT